MEETFGHEPQKSNTRAVLGVIAAIIVILGVAIIYRVLHRTATVANYIQKQSAPTTLVQSSITPSATPTIAALQSTSTSNTQLDQDTQDIQNSLDKLNTNVNNIDQGFANASNDTPQ